MGSRRKGRDRKERGPLLPWPEAAVSSIVTGPLAVGEFRGKASCAPSEYHQIGQRIATQPIRAMQSRRRFSRREKPGHGGHLRIAIDADSAHHVMRRGTHFHRLFRDVQIGELLELVIHAGQLALDVLRCFRHALLDPGNIEKDTAVRRASACLDFAIDAPRNVIAGEQFGRTARVLIALRIAPALFFSSPQSALCTSRECRRT